MNKVVFEQRRHVYSRALEKWGKEAQLIMVIEEMSELTKEICKTFRGKTDAVAIADETADVKIMLEQACEIFGINDLVCEHMDMKIQRLAERLEMEAPINEGKTDRKG